MKSIIKKTITKKQFELAQQTVEEYYKQTWKAVVIRRRKGYWTQDFEKNEIIEVRVATRKDVFYCTDGIPEDDIKQSFIDKHYLAKYKDGEGWNDEGIIFKSDVKLLKRIK